MANQQTSKHVTNAKSISAIFGGTFDPPHYGHLKPLQQVLDIFNLPKMSLMPANKPALKGKVTEIKHRLEMTKLLCELDSRLNVDTTEIDRGGHTYTVETLAHIKQMRPDESLVFVIGLDSLRNIGKWYKYKELFTYAHIVVMCREIEKSIPDWHLNTSNVALRNEFDNKLASYLYNFHTSERQFDRLIGSEMDDEIRSLLKSKLALPQSELTSVNPDKIKDILLRKGEGKLWFVNNDLVTISSTQIRELVHKRVKVDKYLPNSIMNYIEQHNLYE